MSTITTRGYRWTRWLALLTVLLMAVCAYALCTGSTGSFFRPGILRALAERTSPEYLILVTIRLPRIILAVAVGGMLSIAGVLLQGLFRNVLVEPYTLGISGGAALGVSLGTILGRMVRSAFIPLPLFGFAGALAVIVLLFLSSSRGPLRIHRLLLMGVMISFICSSLIMIVMALTHLKDLQGIIFWTMGSLDRTEWAFIIPLAAVALIGLLGSCACSRALNALALGEEEALHLGIPVEGYKRFILFLTSFLTAAAVSVTGIIGFVGLIVPHLARSYAGTDHRILIPASFLAGGIFLVLSDTLARTIIAPLELPVGVITGIVGGILFLAVLVRNRMPL